MSANILLMSDEMIKERSTVHGNTDPSLIRPDIKMAQDLYILPIIGTALYQKLLDAINAGSWTGLANYKNLLDNYIVDALMYYTMMQLPFSLSFQMWNKGMIRKVGENTELPSMSDLMDMSSRYKNAAESYGNRLRLYLKQNAYSMFPEYLNPGNGIDTVNPDTKGFSMPIYLGDDDCGCDGFNNKPYS